MGHEAHHVAGLIADPGDLGDRAIGVRSRANLALGRAVAEHHPPVRFEARQQLGVGEIGALTVLDGNAKDVTGSAAGAERRRRLLDPDVHELAHEVKMMIADESPR